MAGLRRFVLLLCLMIPGISAAADTGTVLDRSTGATITYSKRPWLLALEQPHFAANARDYIALYAVELNIAGKRRYHLAAFFWSTIAGRSDYAGPTPRLVLRVDDRTMQLDPLGRSPRDMGISAWPMKLPGPGARLQVYEVDASVLAQLGRTKNCSARLPDDAGTPEDVWFETWREAQAAFRGFAEATLE